jgi:hypothetical protein
MHLPEKKLSPCWNQLTCYNATWQPAVGSYLESFIVEILQNLVENRRVISCRVEQVLWKTTLLLLHSNLTSSTSSQVRLSSDRTNNKPVTNGSNTDSQATPTVRLDSWSSPRLERNTFYFRAVGIQYSGKLFHSLPVQFCIWKRIRIISNRSDINIYGLKIKVVYLLSGKK